mgnify:CR=1 FL=1
MEETAVQAAVQITWWQIAAFALGSGFVSALMAKGVQYVAWRSSRKARATRDALQIAVRLERFATRAAALIMFNDSLVQMLGPHGAHQHFDKDAPLMEDFPESIAWIDIDATLRARAMGLSVEHEMLVQRLRFTLLYACHDGITSQDARHKTLGYHAFRCLQLAKDLRAAYGIPALNVLGEEESVENTLRSEYQAVLDQRAKEADA